jgi:dTDP-4-dehydrorhamnose 3,5-epimerase
MVFRQTSIPDVMIVETKVSSDNRGFFMETFRADAFAKAGLPATFVQDNHSGSVQGVLRGLHYQVRHPQGKLVRVVAGEVYDVAVDLRKASATFGGWTGVRLSAENGLQLWVPPGFAHGFYTLSEWAEVLYKATEMYTPEWDRTLLWSDPDIRVDWPLLGGRTPTLSDKDAQGKLLRDAEIYEE